MKVIIDGTKTFYMGWKYDNPTLDAMLKEVGISPEQAREMTVPRIADAIGIKMNFLPKPSATHCIILNDERVKIMDVVVKRHYKDEYNVDKARTFSMQKAIDVLFPNVIIDESVVPGFAEKVRVQNKKNKEVRRAFWDAYRNRNKKNKENGKKTDNVHVPQAVQAH
jgi:hypothetical protein